MSPLTQHELKGDGEQTWFVLADYVARLKNHMAHRRESSLNDLLNNFRVDDEGAIRIAPREDSHDE